MQVRDGIAMDADGGTTFTTRKTYEISRFTLFFSIAILACSIVAAGLLILHFGACPGEIAVKTQVCGKENVIPMITHYGENRTKTTKFVEPDDGTHGDDSHTDANVGFRLPRSIEPISYDIKLIPFLFDGNFTFDGEVNIQINITETCQNITLHAVALNIYDQDVHVRIVADANGVRNTAERTLGIRNQYFVETKQFYVIEMSEQLQRGYVYDVYIKYTGVLNDLLQGFYRSSYKVNNTTRWVAATQFQATDARRALPCFDEPALKAIFKLTLARPSNMTTLSNMPQIGQPKPVEGLAGYVWDEYKESMRMSSYLLAFVVMDFKSIGDEEFKVWTRADAVDSAKYALSIGPKILKFYEQFFNISYPLPKVDMISLPDFTAGAMENWGLITFREAALLYEEDVTARMNKQRVATVVAHELAHQWFGNLVTPSWWSDLWLNEGFASYMEYAAVDEIEPLWKAMDQFVLHEVQSVLTLDALSTSHRIWIEVHNPDEINEIFDRISYGKGAAIIRMMEHFLTRDVFRSGLSAFLKEKSFQAADQNDLWQHLTEQALLSNVLDNGTSVKEIMDTWTLQTGFPEVIVTRNYTTKQINFKQQRFVYVDRTNKNRLLGQKLESPLWWVPLSYTTAMKKDFDNTKPKDWMRATPTLSIRDSNLADTDWLLVNIQQTGYYRVNYDENNWKLLVQYLQDPTQYANIAPATRAQLIDDALNLARGGRLNYTIALDITKYLAHEKDYVPWKAAMNALNFLDAMLIKGGEYDKLKRYILHLIDHVYNDVRFNDPPNTEMLIGYMRTDILMIACHLGHKECVQNSQREFKKWQSQPTPDMMNPISPNLRTIVYCTAIKYGDQTEWDFAWERYQKTTVSSEKEILLSAMGCSRETWILMRFLERSLTDNYGIRKHDVFRVFHAVSGNVLGQPIVFHFIRKNWQQLKDYLGSVVTNLHAIVNLAARRINTRAELEEFKRFTHQHIKDTSSGRAIQQAIESTESNIEWMDKNYNTIVEWLGNVTYSS